MPIYEYQCTSCDSVVEVLQNLGDPAPESHEDCPDPVPGKLVKILSASGYAMGASRVPAPRPSEACGNCERNPSCPMH